jgi:MoxR-like ATPase
LVDIAAKTRADPRVLQGASTRSLVAIMPALQVHAVANRRDYVTAADVEAMSPHVFSHRLEIGPGAESIDAVLKECMQEPLERLARGTMQR